MQLKKLILCGFKSFADKTEFDFGDGVTVIVGPNGCGKSNVVDAIKWVLGEQSAKSLRGGQMLDVIFNGSGTRKSMGYAEVSLVFNNASRLLAVDADEVVVSRRLYRSGESAYMLNNKSCRLKDIREAFMDTGIGADAYSIIEQGKVETLLQTSKEDRRAVFEEAAGISKYKTRKKETLRKLERTEQNVLRLQDVIAELEKQLRSIKYQAGKARSYQAYSARLTELRMNQFLSEYKELQDAAVKTQTQVTHLQDELAGLIAELNRNQAALSVLAHQADQVDSEIHQVETSLLQCTSQIGTQQDHIDSGHRRCAELQDMLTRNQQQIQSLRYQSQKLHDETKADQQQIAQAQEQLDLQQSSLRQLQDTRQQKVLTLNEYRSQMEDEKSGLIDIVRRTAQIHNEINTLDMQRNNLSGRKTRLHDRSGKISDEMEQLLSNHAQLDQKLQRIRQLQRDSQAQLEQKRQQLAQLSEDRLGCSEDLAAAKEYRSGLLSRQQLLLDMEAALEGVDQGVKQILQSKKDDPQNFYYVKGMVAELIQAEVKYAAIVEAALAEKSQHLVALDSQALLEDSRHLEELRGRVQMICMDCLPAFHDGFDFSGYPEVQAKLIELVTFSGDYSKLAWHLLGKTVLVDNMASAFRMAQIAPQGYRWVTLDGDVLEPDGTLYTGPQTGRVGLISRKSELRQIEIDVAGSAERITELQNQVQQYDSQAQHLEKNLQELRTAIYEIRTEEIEAASQLEQVDQNVTRLKQEQPLIAAEIERIEAETQEALNLQASSQKSLEELNETNNQRQQRVDDLQYQIEILQSEDQEILDEITELKVSVGQTHQITLALREKIARVQSQLQQHEHHITALQNDLQSAQRNHDASQRAILTAEGKIAELFLSRQEYQARSIALRDSRDELQSRKKELVELVSLQNQQNQQLNEKLHEAQLQLSEKRLRCDNLLQRGHEELSVDLAEKLTGHEFQETNWQAVADEIEDLRNKINRLGNINLDSISEQETLEERANYLTQQANDLAESKRQLEQLIEKINVESTELFRQSFEAIRVNFSELFRKLFGGGRAEIILEDPDNILECGIEIVARPPGKQLQSISLLSGGEKTMTAVALLMGIFRSKPSPFCLLDEVDAALDESNVERFNLVVREFLTDSQFVIITHSRRTMSIADVIYGVTMQEQGVSRKVSVRFSGEEEEDPGTAVA